MTELSDYRRLVEGPNNERYEAAIRTIRSERDALQQQVGRYKAAVVEFCEARQALIDAPTNSAARFTPARDRFVAAQAGLEALTALQEQQA